MSELAAGKRDRLITVERGTATTDDFGGAVIEWARLGDAWAEALPISDAERWRAQQVASNPTIRFRIPWGLYVETTDRVVYDGRVYDIVGEPKEIGRHEGQEITASARD